MDSVCINFLMIRLTKYFILIDSFGLKAFACIYFFYSSRIVECVFDVSSLLNLYLYHEMSVHFYLNRKLSGVSREQHQTRRY